LYSYKWAMPRERPLCVHVLALNDCAPIVPVGMIDLLRKSIDLAKALPSPRARRRVELTLVSHGEKVDVRAAGGVVLRCDKTLRTAGPCDVAIVPALDPDVIDRLSQNRSVVS
jgi:hypothetical protein